MDAPVWADDETKHLTEGMQALLTPSPSPPASGTTSPPALVPSPSSLAPPPPGHAFPAPRRPSFGAAGRPISLRANHLEVSLRPGYMYCYRWVGEGWVWYGRVLHSRVWYGMVGYGVDDGLRPGTGLGIVWYGTSILW